MTIVRRLAHAHEIPDEIRPGGEHRPDQADDEVERVVLVAQVLGVTLLELDRELLGLRTFARLLVEVVGQIDAGDLRARTRGWQRDLPGAARDVEHPDPGPEREAVEELERTRQQEGGEVAVVARFPDGLQAGLQGAHLRRHRRAHPQLRRRS